LSIGDLKKVWFYCAGGSEDNKDELSDGATKSWIQGFR
jgi:hypothetical protein